MEGKETTILGTIFFSSSLERRGSCLAGCLAVGNWPRIPFLASCHPGTFPQRCMLCGTLTLPQQNEPAPLHLQPSFPAVGCLGSRLASAWCSLPQSQA